MTLSLCAVSGMGYKGFLNRRLNFVVRVIIRRRRSWRHVAKGSTTLGGTMKNPLDSLWGTVIAGVLLTAVLYAIARFAMGG
jgi:hypothetical protein